MSRSADEADPPTTISLDSMLHRGPRQENAIPVTKRGHG
jgi:hypothetical protein